MNDEMNSYEFLKKFTEACSALPNGGKGTKCSIYTFSPLKTKKGTKNAPCPFYDRDMITENENERFILAVSKEYTFLYGDRYEDHVEDGHVFESEKNPDAGKKKEKPDSDVPMLSLNRTGKLCVDVVCPEKVGDSEYYKRESDGKYIVVASDILIDEVKSWLPSKGVYQPPVFMQFSLENVTGIYIHETKQLFTNMSAVPSVLDDCIIIPHVQY